MKNIVIFGDEENKLISRVTGYLAEGGHEPELDMIEKNRKALVTLARAVSLYPSIHNSISIGGYSRDINSLISRLCKKNENELIFSIPTKGILGKSYLQAKVNFFYLLNYIIREIGLDEKLSDITISLIKEIIYTLMAEEVFLEIIIDDETEKRLKEISSYRLIDIWEFRLDHGVKKFAPALDNLWKARDSFAPSYGSLLGTTELIQLSRNIDPFMMEFLESESFNTEERFALEEFIFGMNYEDLANLRSQMLSSGRSTYRKEEIEEKTGSKLYGNTELNDPREFYSFFLQRNNNAKFRNQASLTGPKKTLEEHIMLYLLTRE